MKLKNPLDPKLFKIDSAVGRVSFIALFLPILFEHVSSVVLNTVNTAVISRFSENAAAAIGACGPILSMLLIVQNVITLGSSVIISNSIGAEKLEDARKISFTGILVCLLCSFIIAPTVFLLTPIIMGVQNLEGEIFAIAVSYFRIRLIFLPIQALSSYILAVLRCYGHTKYTFYVGVLSNVLNLAFSVTAVLLPGATPHTAASIMAIGCGIASTISLICVIIVSKKKGVGFKRPDSLGVFGSFIKRILNIGIPSAISSMSFSLSQVVTTAFVALIGGYALTAKVIFTQILNYTYMFSYSAGTANSILVGMRYGAGEYVEMDKMNRALTRLTSLVNLTVSLLILLLRVPIVGIFSKNENILALAIGVFAVDILTEQGRAFSHIYEYALRAIGDVWVNLIALVCSCWMLGIGLAYVCAIQLNLGIIGCWIGLAADECFRGVFTYLRWKSVTKRLIRQKT